MAEIYLLTFKNGKRYVGAVRAQSAEQRYKAHAYSAKKGSSMLVHQAWRVFGAPILRVLSRAENSSWEEEEIKFIKKMNSIFPSGYNLSQGGRKITPQVSVAASLANKGRVKSEKEVRSIKARNSKRIWSKSSREKIAASRIGKPMSESTKRKIAASVSGKKNPFFGKKHSKKTKEKIAAARKGKKLSAETRLKMSMAHRRRKCS